MRRQQGSGGCSSGRVDGLGEAMIKEEAEEVDECFFDTGSGGGDRARRWRLGGGARPTMEAETAQGKVASLCCYGICIILF